MADVFLTMMKPKKITRTKKAMTLEVFADVVKTDLARMATKDDLKGLATKQELAAIREEMTIQFSTLGDRIVNAKDELQEQIAGLKYAKEIDELRARVNMLEHKVGIRPSRRAA